jgi:hypothetical protein
MALKSTADPVLLKTILKGERFLIKQAVLWILEFGGDTVVNDQTVRI